MSETIRHVVMGLQSTGKTTFAAALWYLVDSGQVPTSLKRGLHIGDHAYLERLAQIWADGWRVPRTSQQELAQIAMNLRDPKSGSNIALKFVDLAGETFERAYASREMSKDAAGEFTDVGGLMLFVSAGHVRDDVTLLDMAPYVGDTSEDVPEDESMVEDFDPAKTPRQVQLVDLLQSFSDVPVNCRPEHIAVIISAWDLGPDHDDPQRWLREEMPLLDQYLRNSRVATRVYGVSAQGGEVPEQGDETGKGDRERLLQLSKASERIRIVGNGASEHDLTHPVRWLSGLENGE
ncbi:hypothetical protein FHT86_000820 [Rhizobium sp. BK313]|uniref:TRAFAC clade GTPase domain-containing protein n=1 Tax=Rhizobium sp. BK313 TaxID=2587081 RepID=UPI0010CEF757|nr:hypothetical protein [Rhizobium sp. BK313]MBB3452564.1 hypothetical protein [Rhizobium sp. BK313]